MASWKDLLEDLGAFSTDGRAYVSPLPEEAVSQPADGE